MSLKGKELIVYIGSIEAIKIFRERCAKITDSVSIGAFNNLGKAPDDKAFESIAQIMSSGTADLTIFHLPSIGEQIGNKSFIENLKALIKKHNSAFKKTQVYVIDPDGLYDDSARKLLDKFNVKVIDDEKDASGVLSDIVSSSEYLLASAAKESEAFAGMVGGLSELDFGEDEQQNEEDNEQQENADDVEQYSSNRIPGMRDDTPDEIERDEFDPFAEISGSAEAAGFDPFAEIDKGGDIGISDESDEYNVTQKRIENVDDLFSEDEWSDGFDDAAEDEFADAAPIGEPQQQGLFDELEFNDGYGPLDIDPDELASSSVDYDPFGDGFGDNGNYGDYNDNQDDYYQEYDNGAYNDPTKDLAIANGSYGELTVVELLDRFGGLLSNDEYAKMLTMVEPNWDYTIENDENVGNNGGMLSGFFKNSNKISQVSEDTLANSEYIYRKESEEGYYSPPQETKIVVSYSPKGGSGKTTISVMTATQLNWYFNRDLMQKRTTSINARVLLMSFNEFDDIPTHGIGYGTNYGDDDSDGRNIVELLRRIEETGGEPQWDDISHCFVAAPRNMIFYLPSVSKSEALADNIEITAEDYKRALDVCSRFFQFIVIDSPDIFYQERQDLMSFAFTVADVIMMIIEPDARSTSNLYDFYKGISDNMSTEEQPIDPNKSILVVNKYAEKGNPYISVPIGQLDYEKICKAVAKHFTRFVAIPWTQPRVIGNIIYGTDPKVKYAAAELADDVLEIIDTNDAKKKRQKHRRRH